MFPEDLAEAPAEIGNIHARAAYLPTDHETSGRVRTFLNGAIADVLTERNGTLIDGDFEASLNRWISVEKLDAIVISLPTVGFTKDFLTSQTLPVSAHRFIRDWDRSLWPHATAGFFKLKSILPKIHTSLAPVRKDDLFPDV
jgi:deoxyribodipyrimidine photo-lyase